jgi:Protein of unknown function (DUF2789)
MDTSAHTLAALFAQLGLPDGEAEIEAFISAHRPLPPDLPLCDAPCWNPSQAEMLREALQQDAEWSAQVDELAARLSR